MISKQHYTEHKPLAKCGGKANAVQKVWISLHFHQARKFKSSFRQTKIIHCFESCIEDAGHFCGISTKTQSHLLREAGDNGRSILRVSGSFHQLLFCGYDKILWSNRKERVYCSSRFREMESLWQGWEDETVLINSREIYIRGETNLFNFTMGLGVRERILSQGL